ncbi:MAG: transporter substrate-binding domain-containing protein [Oscillospiraceae bacterium]|nr:transporter substrate-binding domain-containing protein [Oscillospiraceae bacterium]
MRKFMTLTLALSLALTLTACGGKTDPTPTPDGENTTPVHTVAPVANLTGVDTSAIPGVEDGVLTVGMECAYAPYNWTQLDDSNGAVPIVNNPGSYANGYDVMIAQRLCEAYGWELEVMAIEWDGLNAALASGTVDMVIAGQSMTAVRMAQVDMAGPYFYASIVCVTKAGSEQAAATGISKLTGTCTAQTGTVWYDTCLPQISGAQMMPQAETAPAMVMAVESGTVDFICTDMPTAMAACATYPDLTILDFTGTEDNFQVSEEEINIGLSVRQGNSQLQECANTVLNDMSVEDFNALMNQAISVQPEL